MNVEIRPLEFIEESLQNEIKKVEEEIQSLKETMPKNDKKWQENSKLEKE